jgi:PXPV repeat (3 copies)
MGTFCPLAKEKAMLQSVIQTASPVRKMLMAGAAAALAVAAMGFSGGAQARSDVQFSVGVVLPGAQIGVTNAYPVYNPPVYVQPAPVYYQPRPIYYQPRPVYVQPAPIYVQPAPVYYGRPHGWHKRHGHHRDDHDRGHGYGRGGHYVQSAVPQPYVHGPQGYRPPGYYYGR